MADAWSTRTRMAIGIVAGLAAVALLTWQFIERNRSETRLAETQQALAYACGYALGQYDALRNAGTTATPPKDDACKTYKDVAAAHGFTGAPTR
jgi:hypothetical protein